MNNKEKNAKKLEINSIILFLFMMGTNICNYLFQIFTGRLLSVRDYGIVNTLMSLIVYFSIPNSIISLLSARYIALSQNMGSDDRTSSVIRLLLKCGAVITLVIALAGLLFADPIASLFNLNSRSLVYGCAAIAMINAATSVMYGILQGLQFFLPYGIQGLINAACKLAGSILLILLGYKAGGIIAAMVAGAILTILYCAFHIRRYLAAAVRYKGGNVVDLKDFFRFTLGMIIAQSSVTALTNGDILLVKALFDDSVAGTYSSAMVIGKIAMYVSTAVIAALFPMVVEEHGKGHDTKKLFRKALLYGGGSSLAIALGMNLLGRHVIGFLFGQRYLEAIAYLPAVCMFVVPMTFLTIIMNYVLAIDRAGFFAASVLVSAALILAAVRFFHTDVVQVMTLCGGILSLDTLMNLLFLSCAPRCPRKADGNAA